jgi:hypothetical protein
VEPCGSSRVMLRETSVDDVRKLFKNISKQDNVDYSSGLNKQWFLFEQETGCVGHGSLTKLGPSKHCSNHWRGGGIWIVPDSRSRGVGLRFISALLRYALFLMPGPEKTIHGRAWTDTALTRHYARNGWVFGRVYKGGFVDICKTFTEIEGCLYEIQENDELRVSPGLVHPGDLTWSFPEICTL